MEVEVGGKGRPRGGILLEEKWEEIRVEWRRRWREGVSED